MAIQEAGGYCRQCGKPVLVRRKGTNHVLHLLLSIVTGGLWLIVWLFCAIKIGGWPCTKCGNPASRR